MHYGILMMQLCYHHPKIPKAIPNHNLPLEEDFTASIAPLALIRRWFRSASSSKRRVRLVVLVLWRPVTHANDTPVTRTAWYWPFCDTRPKPATGDQRFDTYVSRILSYLEHIALVTLLVVTADDWPVSSTFTSEAYRIQFNSPAAVVVSKRIPTRYTLRALSQHHTLRSLRQCTEATSKLLSF